MPKVKDMDDLAFPISFWVAPPAELVRYQEVAECGFTVVPVPAETPDAGRYALDLAQQVGLKAVIVDPRIHRDLPDQPGWEGVVQAVIDDYGRHPALWGYFLTDEPSFGHFANLARLTKAFQERDPAHVPYINLFPNYASAEQLGTVDYRQHVHAFLEIVRPPILSYDHYALMEWGDRPEYFANLEVIRAEALWAGVPFWNIILSTPHFCYRDPSPADLRWQVYTTLAYGGKGLAYFTYWTLDVENYRNGIIGLYGQRTAKYEVVRQLNLELQHLGPHLRGLTSRAVYHWPDAPQGARVLPGDGLVASLEGEVRGGRGQFVIGEFTDADGLPWVMVVNRDRERSVWTTLKLRTVHGVAEEVARSTGRLRAIARDQGVEAGRRYADGLVLQFWLAPADGRLIRLSG